MKGWKLVVLVVAIPTVIAPVAIIGVYLLARGLSGGKIA